MGAGDICAIPTSPRRRRTRRCVTRTLDPLRPHRVSAAVVLRRDDPASKADLDKMSTALHKLIDEGYPSFTCAATSRRTRRSFRRRRIGHRCRGAPADRIEFGVRGRDAHAARPLPRVDPSKGAGAGALQATDGWSRPVRRRVARGRAAASWIGRGLRDAHRRRLGPAQLLARRREGHPRAGAEGRDRGVPALGLQGGALRRVVPPGRLQRDRSRSRSLARTCVKDAQPISSSRYESSRRARGSMVDVLAISTSAAAVCSEWTSPARAQSSRRTCAG